MTWLVDFMSHFMPVASAQVALGVVVAGVFLFVCYVILVICFH